MGKQFEPSDGQAWLLAAVFLIVLALLLSWAFGKLSHQWQQHGHDVSFEDVLNLAKPSLPEAALLDLSPPEQGAAKSGIHRLPSKRSRKIFAGKYAQADFHRAIAVSASGHWGYATRRDNPRLAARNAMWFCERFRRRAGADQACRVVHIDKDWVPPQADQSAYLVDPALLELGIMPDAEVVLNGVYAHASGHKALASSPKGYFGYAYDRATPEQAVQAALDFCNGGRNEEPPNDCKVRVIDNDWVKP